MPVKSEIRIRDLVILIKYAQGAVAFNSLFDYVAYMKPGERKILLSQIVDLTGHFSIDNSAAELAIRNSGLSDTCAASLIWKGGNLKTRLQEVIELPESELESSFKLLLALFSAGYQDGYQRHKNAATTFWYWDYSENETALKVVGLPYDECVNIEDVLIP
jgi:hypothetical protein